MSSNPTRTNVPVLIAGAGPTGIFAAILLTKMGIPCRVIERHHEISTLSKALVIHARTLEIFHMMGRDESGFSLKETPGESDDLDLDGSPLLNRFMQEGQALADFHVYFGKTLFSVLPMLRNTESHFKYGLFIEQAKTVSILTEELERLGGRIDRGWELLNTEVIETDGNLDTEKRTWVETTIRRAKSGSNLRSTESKVLGSVDIEADQEGKEYDYEVVRSEYLIAADGGKSTVRHKLNIGFQGRTLDNNMILFDGKVKADIPLDNISVVHGDAGRPIAIMPLGDGRVRMTVDQGTISPEEHLAQKSEELTLERFRDLLDKTIAPVKIDILDCSWLTYYRVNERIASQYTHKGRIFLCGDSAHVHSPAGGQGLNMGLQDAYNITWKLALVLKGCSSKSILDTYETERLRAAADVIKLSSNIFGNTMAEDFFRRSLRRLVFLALPYILPRMHHGPPMCMLRIRYFENAINQRHHSQALPSECYQVGVRARDGELCEISSKSSPSVDRFLRLHSLLVNPGTFHILVFTSNVLAKQTFAKISNSIHNFLERWESMQLVSNYNEGIQRIHLVHTITSVPVDVNTIGGLDEAKLYLDESGVLHEKYGVSAKGGRGSIVVLRPDSYIGYRVQGIGEPAWEDVNRYFVSILDNNMEAKL